MLKMVILDDEKMERSFMKKYIDWSSMGIEIAGEASNGIDGLEICKSLRPDIIMSDIRMPHMDGLEFAKKVRELLPDVKIIFVSGYEDFNYARSAIDLNAYGYISKPFRIENIVDAVKKVVVRCDDENRKNVEREQLKKILQDNRNALRDSLLREMMDGCQSGGRIWDTIGFLGLKLIRGKFCVLLVELDEYDEITKGLTQEDLQIFMLNLLELVRNTVEEGGTGEAVKISEKRLAVLLSFEPDKREGSASHEAFSMAEAIRNNLMSSMSVSVTIGVSRLATGEESIAGLFRQSVDSVKYKFFNLKGQIISINDVQITEENQSINLANIDTELTECLRSANDGRINALLDKIFNDILLNRHLTPGALQNICISMVCTAMRFLNEINCNFDDVLGDGRVIWNKLLKFETIGDVKQWMVNVFAGVLETLDSKKKSKNRVLVEKIIEITHERYYEDLTTKELSKEIFLSPNYIGAIFKEETGMGFLEYLTKVRMDKAVEMLKEPKLKVYEIAQKVGYNNTPYFSTLFRDYTGMTPSEFREKIVN